MLMRRFLSAFALTAALVAPIAAVAQDHPVARRVYDANHKDYHAWDAREDRAYHMYYDANHRPYKDFAALNAHDQADYWAWRHNHNDALLKINIR